MKLSKITFYLFFTILLPKSILACSCAAIASFCETAAWNQKVVEVRILAKYEDTSNYDKLIDIEVTETLLDTSGTIDQFMTIVESGTSCDIGVFNWASEGDLYVMTFNDVITYKKPKYPGLDFVQCYTNFLKIENAYVVGAITRTDRPEEERIPYNTFKNTIKDLCVLQNTLNEEVSIYYLTDNGQLTIENLHKNKFEYTIFDASGKLIFYGTIEAKEIKDLFLKALPPGVYFANFRNINDQITKKFILN
jgi:hypothetical protein